MLVLSGHSVNLFEPANLIYTTLAHAMFWKKRKVKTLSSIKISVVIYWKIERLTPVWPVVHYFLDKATSNLDVLEVILSQSYLVEPFLFLCKFFLVHCKNLTKDATKIWYPFFVLALLKNCHFFKFSPILGVFLFLLTQMNNRSHSLTKQQP